MSPEWTEGVCDDGAAILRDGVMVPISELLEHLNRTEADKAEAVSREREECAKVAHELATEREVPLTGRAVAAAIRARGET